LIAPICRSALADVGGQATEQPAWEFGSAVGRRSMTQQIAVFGVVAG
jgi:hypothetical protein